MEELLNLFICLGVFAKGTLSLLTYLFFVWKLGISEKCSANLWNPVKASQGSLAFSHLFFADNLVLFVKAGRKNCMAVKDALDTFCSLSGQKVSHEKSKVFFSPNVAVDTRADLFEPPLLVNTWAS